MTCVHLGLGSNLGDRLAHLRRALRELERGCFEPERISSIYETEPVGPVQEQPAFLNCVSRGNFGGSARDLLTLIGKIEDDLGRVRELDKGPRTIDLDILYFGDEIIQDPPMLVVPHPAIPERRFVLIPLVEMDPNLVHPALGKTQSVLLETSEDDSEVTLYGGMP